MRRFLIGVALVVLLLVSISVGIVTAGWPQWSRALGLVETRD